MAGFIHATARKIPEEGGHHETGPCEERSKLTGQKIPVLHNDLPLVSVGPDESIADVNALFGRQPPT